MLLQPLHFLLACFLQPILLAHATASATAPSLRQFEEVHIEWPARLARAIKESGKVERFIHLRCAAVAVGLS